jgi:hypothetical protein
MRLIGLLATPLVLAGCMGGNSSPAPHGIYQAKVTVGTSGTRTVWLDADGGRFRVSLSAGHGRKVTASDGHTAVTRFRGFMTRTNGSAEFLEATVDPAVAILRDRLEGKPVPDGDRVTGLHRVGDPSASLFTVPATGSPAMVVRQIRIGSVPATGPRPYWLGATLGGKHALYASTSSGKRFSSYSVSYPGVDVEVEASSFGLPLCHATHVVLADGTLAAVTVVTPDLGPCQTTDGTTTSSIDVIGFTTDSTGGLAIVETPAQTIMLSGSAVTQKSAVRLARALRPV